MSSSSSKAGKANKGWFKKGQSGNPAGKPKGRKNRQKVGHIDSAFEVLLETTVPIHRNGETVETLMEDALAWQIVRQAFEGDRKARAKLAEMIIKREEALGSEVVKKSKPDDQVTMSFSSPGEAKGVEEVMVLLDMMEIDGWNERAGIPKYMFKSWIVQKAISRPGIPALEDEHFDKLKKWTRGFEELIWPRRYKGDGRVGKVRS